MTTWIITADSRISGLVKIAQQQNGTTAAIVVGSANAGGVDQVLRVPADESIPAEAKAPTVVELLTNRLGPDDVVLVANRPAERVLGGAVAAKLGLPIFTNVLAMKEDGVDVAAFGGLTEARITCERPFLIIADGGSDVSEPTPSEQVCEGSTYEGAVASFDQAETAESNLSGAKRVVSAGRGFKTEEDLALIRKLANVLGADVACSRPLAEGMGWFPRDRYVGVSGQRIAPELYIATGISGQVQHTMGMRDSKIIVAINQDENAPIFEISDYGIVGDLYEVLPALTDALGRGCDG
jgi:electron transfer flavoprotein alpha subunit